MTMSAVAAAAAAAATYRLTRLVVEDEITRPLREAVFRRFPPETTRVGYALTCPYCMSVYAGAVVASLVLSDTRVARTVVLALALSGAVCLYHDRHGSDHAGAFA